MQASNGRKSCGCRSLTCSRSRQQLLCVVNDTPHPHPHPHPFTITTAGTVVLPPLFTLGPEGFREQVTNSGVMVIQVEQVRQVVWAF